MLHKLALISATAIIAAAQPGGPGPGGDGVWSRNAAFGELETFDLCNGHQPGTGMYHHHINPICLRAQLNDNVIAVTTGRLGTQYAEKTSGWTHSPILGWAFDGYPVYGPYGYSSPTDPTSAVKRLQTGFRLRTITQRHTLPDWVLPYQPAVSQTLTSAQYGPDVTPKFPLGRYVQDYDYVPGLGDLDQYNGRFAVTPEYPAGTYAYFVTIASDGSPAFPYIFNVQFYGTASGNAPVPTDAVDYFNSAPSSDPGLSSWYTKGSQQAARAITGCDPSAGPSTTWPVNVPAGVNVSGGTRAPALADVQRVRYTGTNVYVNSNDLPSYVIGPWFEASMPGGVFMNWAAPNPMLAQVPRKPAPAPTKSASGMGPVGMWVNGVAIFNVLDGASYRNSAGDDFSGGTVTPRAAHFSAASQERGPIAPGSLVSAYPEFNASLATSIASAASTAWPATLGGSTVTVIDSTGAQLSAGILYASPNQVNYQVPSNAAPGLGRVVISSGGTSVTGTVNIASTYPGIFRTAADGLAAAQTLTVTGEKQVTGSTSTPIDLAAGAVYLLLYGTGIGSAPVTASIGDVNATVSYSGPQGTYPGLDQVNVLIPPALAGKGRVNVVVTAAGKPSNPVYIVVQ